MGLNYFILKAMGSHSRILKVEIFGPEFKERDLDCR